MKNYLTSSRISYLWSVACFGFFAMLLAKPLSAQLSGSISRIAGTGTGGYSGDGGPAVDAELWYPSSVGIDSSDNLWIADSNNGVLREFTVGGDITTVNPDDTLVWPYQLAIDSDDNVYVYDADLQAVYEISGGSITDITPDFTAYEGLAVDSSNNVYSTSGAGIMEYNVGTSEWTQLDIEDGDGHTVTPDVNALAVDSAGDIYVAEACDVRKLAYPSPGNSCYGGGHGCYVASVYAGSVSECSFGGDDGPATSAYLKGGDDLPGIALDGSGNLYIADFGNNRVREVLASSGYIYTVAGDGTDGANCNGGSATSTDVVPYGLVVDSSGYLYIADYGNNQVCEVN